MRRPGSVRLIGAAVAVASLTIIAACASDGATTGGASGPTGSASGSNPGSIGDAATMPGSGSATTGSAGASTTRPSPTSSRSSTTPPTASTVVPDASAAAPPGSVTTFGTAATSPPTTVLRSTTPASTRPTIPQTTAPTAPPTAAPTATATTVAPTATATTVDPDPAVGGDDGVSDDGVGDDGVGDDAASDPPELSTELVLRADGIGSSTFGADRATVAAALAAVLGAPNDEADEEFPNPVDDHFENEDGYGFPAPYAHFACYANELCVSYGGASADAPQFTGWTYSASDAGPMPNPQLATADGVRPNVHWADVADVIQVQPEGCYNTGYGTASGIDVELVSEDSWFGSMSVTPTPVPVTPDPAEVMITLLSAGAEVSFAAIDC